MNLQNNKTKNFTPLPNEIFSLHLSTGELATYAVLMRLEDPRTYECWPSYETIGKAIGKSKSSVKRYVAGLVEKGLITVEPTSVIMRNGLKKNGNLRYHIRPSERRWSGTPSTSCTSPKPPARDIGYSGNCRRKPQNRRIRPYEPLRGLAGRNECHRAPEVWRGGASRLRRDGKFRVCGTVFGPWPKPLPKRCMRAKPTPLFMEEQRMKKEEFIRIRVAGWQKKYISLQAEKVHKSLSQYVRDAAMDKDVTVIDGVDDLIRELRRQGNNLNQLVVMARQGPVELVNMEPFMEVYENTWQTLNSLLSRVG